MTVAYGRIVIEEGYKNGSVVATKRKVTESIPLKNRRELFDNVFRQLDVEAECIEFKIYKDKHTHEPYRIEITSETNS